MPRPAVSVVLPCYNAASTLERTLDSLLGQTLPDMEILAVDDGSTDTTPQILKRYFRLDPRVRPVFLPRSGNTHALNAGLNRVRGRYIARMDADDISFPRRLEEQAGFLEDNPGIGVVGCKVVFGGDHSASRGYALHVDWQNELLEPGSIRANRFVEAPLAQPSIMFRAELPLRLGGYRHGPFPEDYELLLRWMQHEVAMAKLEKRLLFWRDSPERLSRSDPRFSRWAFFRVKSVYLARWLRINNPFHPWVYILGAGRLARRRVALLERQGIRIRAFVDMDPRKVGRYIRGRPVIAMHDLPPPGKAYCISYVGTRLGREEALRYLHGQGYQLERDYLPAA